ncbi:MAG: hypothetical protein PHF35_03345 [Candidatus Moranbacteria bacterium]|nr:hypothetical protein [Candidatus Moranbacteria bacterium]
MLKIARSVFVITAVGAIAGTLTWSQYTAKSQVTDNLMKTLSDPTNIVIDKDGVYGTEDSTGNTLPVNIDDMYPGYTSAPYYFAVVNKGQMPFTWNFNVINTANSGGPNSDGLKNVLKAKAWQAGVPDGYDYKDGFNCQNESLYSTTSVFDDFVTNWRSESVGILPNGKAVCFKFEFYLPDNLVYSGGGDPDDNLFKSAASRYTLEADANQVTNP